MEDLKKHLEVVHANIGVVDMKLEELSIKLYNVCKFSTKFMHISSTSLFLMQASNEKNTKDVKEGDNHLISSWRIGSPSC